MALGSVILTWGLSFGCCQTIAGTCVVWKSLCSHVQCLSWKSWALLEQGPSSSLSPWLVPHRLPSSTVFSRQKAYRVAGSPRESIQRFSTGALQSLWFGSQIVSFPPYSIGQEQATGQPRFNKVEENTPPLNAEYLLHAGRERTVGHHLKDKPPYHPPISFDNVKTGIKDWES